jgi:hypothetical protein
MADQSLDFISELTGLPQDKLGVKGISKEPEPKSFIQEFTGGKAIGYSSAGTLNPIEQISKVQNVSGIYTDPLESYREYGVPLNPFADWNEERALRQSTGQKWANGLTKAGITTLGSLYENTIGVFAGLGSLATGGEYYDNFVGRQVDSVNNWAQKNLPNYYTHAEETGSIGSNLLTANFWADKVANGLGYTLGSIATMWLGTGELGLVGKAIGGTAKATSAAGKALGIGGKAISALDDAAALGSRQLALYKAGKAIETGADLASLARASRISTASQRLAVATQMSLAEASVEARETKNRFIEEQTAKWQEENPGQEVPEDVMAGIEESANAAGNTSFAINLPILATSNLLMFGKMFKGASVGERQIYNLEKDAAGKLVESGMEGKWGKAFTQSKRMFGKTGENMFSEGVQEGAQFAASEFSRSYYGDKFNDGAADMSKSLSESLSRTFGTKEGLENMIIGAIVGGGTGAVSRIVGADSKLAKARTANSAKVIEYINRGGLTKAIENMESNAYNIALVNQIEESNKILNSDESTPVQKAIARQRGERARVQLIRSEVARLDKVGGTDYLMEQLDDAASMPEDEFKKAFGYRQNVSLKDQTGKTQTELVQDIKDKAELSLKRSRQVQDILAKYQPKNTFLPKVLESLQNEETRQNKDLQALVRNQYANMLHGGLIDIDVIDEQIDNIYDHLIKIAPSLGQISREDFVYKVKVGEVKANENGSLEFSGKTKTAADEKLRDKINEVFQAKAALNPADAEDFANAQAELSRLIGRRESLTQAFDNIRRNPEQMDLYVEAQQLRRKADEDRANADRATQAIENAETADELREAMPEDAPEEVIAQAETRLEELEKLEKEEAAKLSTMSDDQINAMDEEGLPPIVAAALAKERDKREKKRIAERTIDNTTGQLQRRDEFTPTASYTETQQELSDAEAAAFKEISVSSGGFIFTVSGRTYLNLNEDPIDAIIFDQDGKIVGVKLTDAATSNEVSWRVDDTNEQDTAIAESLIFSILLQASSIRSDEQQRNISTAEAQEINRIRGGVIAEDVTDKHRKELEAQRDTLKGKDKKLEVPSTEDPEALAKFEEEFEKLVAVSDIGKTAGLTDGQIRTQIEVIKQDLIEIEEILAAERQLAMEAGFSKKEFENDGNIKTLKAVKKTHKALLTKKIKELAARKKAAIAQTAETEEARETVAEEIEQAPTEEEVDEITRGEQSKISRIEDEIAQLQVVATELKKIADGVYPGQDVEAAKRELRNTQSKISRRKESIRKSNELIQRINEERELEKLRQAGDTAEGTSPTAEGEGIEGTDIDSREGSTSEGLDGTTTNEELEALRKQREELERIDKTMDNPEDGPTDVEENPFIETVVVSEGNIDAPLVKGEVASNEDFTEQIVDDNGNTSTVMLQQKVEGETIMLFPEMLTDNSIIPTGTIVTFEVDESTDWWNSEDPKYSNNKKDLTEDKYWEQVPIYIVAQLSNGETVKIGMLAAYNETTGSSRQEIYNLLKKGLTPIATIDKKLFNSANVVNARTTDGQVFFYPASQLVKPGKTPTIAVVRLKDSMLVLVDQNDNVLPFEAGKLLPGQVAMVVEDPNGNPAIIVASTKDMTEEGRTIAVNHLIKESPEASLFGEIVGLNKLPVEIADENDAIEFSETEDPTKLDYEKFMNQVTLTDGRVLFTFYSKSANKLVRINEEQLKKALLGQSFTFSFSEAARNERGWNTLVTVQEDKSRYSAVAPNLKQEFLDIIMQKKFQVSIDRMGNTEAYVSPITGIEYPTYFDYLTSTQEFDGQPRTEGKGANVILATDSPGNAYRSAFFDVGIEFSRLSAANGNTGTRTEIQTNEAVRSLDSIDSQAPAPQPQAQTQPAAPVTDPRVADIERRREEELDKAGLSKSKLKNVPFINKKQLIQRNEINDKYDAELAALEKPAGPAPQTKPQPSVPGPVNVVTVYHHTSVAPQDFDFGNFQRGKDQISQFGDGLNASSTTTPFLVKRYGDPIAGEINESDFILIDANKSEKEIYEELKAKGYKFSNPATGSYISDNPDAEYNDTEKANESPAIINLFNDFQKSNPEVKGVKILNHIIGNQKVDPFYVIYNAKSFYGPGSLSKTQTQPAATTPAVVQAPAATPMQSASQVNTEEWDADLFGAAPTVQQKPVSSNTEIPDFLSRYAVSPEKAAELKAEMQAEMQKELEGLNPTGAPMQDLRDLLDC